MRPLPKLAGAFFLESLSFHARTDRTPAMHRFALESFRSALETGGSDFGSGGRDPSAWLDPRWTGSMCRYWAGHGRKAAVALVPGAFGRCASGAHAFLNPLAARPPRSRSGRSTRPTS